ncbi:hypothetical protein [Pantoea sp. SGAir0175]
MNNETQYLYDLKKEDFLFKNNLTEEDFENSKLVWNDLLKIGSYHAARVDFLKETAIMISSVLQQVNEVHSVRWRVKDPEHLMAKVVRKRNEGNKKYDEISEENYTTIITDLIGIRVLHLFKKDWKPIHSFIESMCQQLEKPVVYIREGDDSESEEYSNQGCLVKVHKAGYRSVHYITKTRPMKDEIFTEIQVRTIFEEGWSEIDHRVRYPNFSDNELLNYFLMIFNRFSGSADEMGSFVLDLRQTIELMELSKLELSRIENEKAESLQKIDELIAKLSSEEEKVGQASTELKELRAEIKVLKNNEATTSKGNLLKSIESQDYITANEKLSKSLGLYKNSNFDKSKSWLDEYLTNNSIATNEKINSLLGFSNNKNQQMILKALGTTPLINKSNAENILKKLGITNDSMSHSHTIQNIVNPKSSENIDDILKLKSKNNDSD